MSRGYARFRGRNTGTSEKVYAKTDQGVTQAKEWPTLLCEMAGVQSETGCYALLRSGELHQHAQRLRLATGRRICMEW